MSTSPAELVAAANLEANLREIADTLAGLGVDLELLKLGRLETLTVTDKKYQGQAKVRNPDTGEDEIVVTDLEAGGVSLRISPQWETGPQWQPVQQAAPVKITRRKPAPAGAGERYVILMDAQAPFHDPAAMAAAYEIVKAVRPTRNIHVGDMLDLAELSRFLTPAELDTGGQRAIDVMHRFVALCNAESTEPDVWLEGNHEKRLPDVLTSNAKAAYGLRPADSPPDAWPPMSIPYLCRLDELGVEWVDGYPANRWWITDTVAVEHGHRVSSARRSKDPAAVSFIHGHIHRHEWQSKTVELSRDERAEAFVASFGCLCDVTGTVPSYGSGWSARGVPPRHVENWQQGAAVVSVLDGGGVCVERVTIGDGSAVWRGDRYTADPAVVEALT